MTISSATLPSGLSDGYEDADSVADLELRKVTVPVPSHGERLDRTLAVIVPEFSRSYLQQLIEAGSVQLNAQTATKTSVRVKAGDQLCIELRPTPQSQAFKPEQMTLNVMFEDEHLLVIDKSAGLVVHPAPGNWSGTLLNGLLAHHEQARFLPRAGIVHRLDKDTSGLMVVAKGREVMDELVRMIADRTVIREYVALAHGEWLGAKQRQVELPIGRDTRNRLRMAVVDLERHAGKSASTAIAMLQTESDYCLVRCRLHTGRTHQIRVHMASLGHPLVSDSLYGGKLAGGLIRQALHARRLEFKHPVTHDVLTFHAPLPADLQAAINNLGLSYNQIS